MKTLTALLLLAAAPSAARSGDDTPWLAEFDAAAAEAEREGKDLLVDFTGSDWCHWCVRLDREVFAHDLFLDDASERFVLVALDFPRGAAAQARVPKPERNQALAEHYGVRSFPTVLVLTADGEELGRTGYRPGGPDAYRRHVEELAQSGHRALDLAARLAAGEPQEGDLRAALDLLAESDLTEATAAMQLLPAARRALERPELELEALRALLRAGQSDADLQVRARRVDPRNESGVLELSVLARLTSVSRREEVEPACAEVDAFAALGRVHDTATALTIYATAAHWHDQFTGDVEKAKAMATRALGFEIQNAELAERLRKIRDA